MRMVTAATRWRTTCSVTPAMSSGWRKDPHLRPSTSTTSSQRYSGDAGLGLPREGLWGISGWAPRAGAQEEEGQGQVPVCVKGTFLSPTAVCTPHQVCVFSVLFPVAVPSLNHSGRCSRLHVAYDTGWARVNWTHPIPGNSSCLLGTGFWTEHISQCS